MLSFPQNFLDTVPCSFGIEIYCGEIGDQPDFLSCTKLPFLVSTAEDSIFILDVK